MGEPAPPIGTQISALAELALPYVVVEGIQRDINKANLSGEKYGYQPNELAKIFSALRVRHYEDIVTQSDWDRSGGKPVPVVRLLASKEDLKKVK